MQKSYAAPTPTICPSGINFKSEQENPGSSKPKASDPDSPESCPAHAEPPVMPSKPPAMLRKSEVTPSKSSDASLGPPTVPKKRTLTPQKTTPGGSGGRAKDILDCITAKYESGMSPQYSKVLALLTSGKSSKVTASKSKEPSAKDDGDHSYGKLTRSDSNSDHKKPEPPSKKTKCDVSSGHAGADAGSGSSKKNTKRSSKKALPKSKKTISSDSDDSEESKDLCGKLRSQPTKEEISKCHCWCTEKWASDMPGVNSYRQRKGIIPESPPPHNFKDHSDYI